MSLNQSAYKPEAVRFDKGQKMCARQTDATKNVDDLFENHIVSGDAVQLEATLRRVLNAPRA
jgi:hypothetical protein